jgi:hypothetical protein
VRDDRHYRRKDKREEHMRSRVLLRLWSISFPWKEKDWFKGSELLLLEPAHPGIPYLIWGYPSCIWFCCPRIPAQIVSSFATGNLICTQQLDTILFRALALVSRDIPCGRRNSAQILSFLLHGVSHMVFSAD